MELYILDDSLRRTEVIESFESVIWTERYSAIGDCEIVIDPGLADPSLFVEGTELAIDKSKLIMQVQTIEKKTENDGTEKLTIKGMSLESILDDRANQSAFATASDPAETLVLTDKPADIVRDLFDAICRNNTDIPEDNIQFLQPGVLSTPGSIAEPADIVEIRLEVDTLYSSIKKICDVYNLGFRLIRNQDESELYFEVYTGDNRTTLQTTYPAVVFSPTLDNLSGVTELHSIALLKTVAYVFAPNGSAIVYAPSYDDTTTGFDRKVVVVRADDIDLAAGVDLDAALQQRGLEELANWRVVVAFDGEIPQSSSYQYGVDYFMGDLVEQRDENGTATNLRVVEQIFVSDSEGERSYPTLQVDLLITPGSWFAWSSSEVWDDADGYWEDA